jgi:hypothetical protein
MAKKPALSLVTDRASTGPKPPRSLGKHGTSLWQRVQLEYGVRDVGGVEMLAAACAALDRAERLRTEIDRDGEVIRARGLVKEHPALRHELANRAFMVKTLRALGLDVEPLRQGPGRPAHGIGWEGDDA